MSELVHVPSSATLAQRADGGGEDVASSPPVAHPLARRESDVSDAAAARRVAFLAHSVAESLEHEQEADAALQAEIDKDVRRLLPAYHFFNVDPAEGDTRHGDAVRRLLFVYAKLNPGVRYVQGMNELAGPIYYVFASAAASATGRRSPADAELRASPFYPVFSPDRPLSDRFLDAEADAFFVLTTLMTDLRDVFVSSLDDSTTGVRAEIARIAQLHARVNPTLATHLNDRLGCLPDFYAFRWLTLLCSQEFELPDVIRLWDSLLAAADRLAFLRRFCVAMIESRRVRLGSCTDFASAITLLQESPLPTPVETVLREMPPVE